jgi:hypothetical protein
MILTLHIEDDALAEIRLALQGRITTLEGIAARSRKAERMEKFRLAAKVKSVLITLNDAVALQEAAEAVRKPKRRAAP